MSFASRAVGGYTENYSPQCQVSFCIYSSYCPVRGSSTIVFSEEVFCVSFLYFLIATVVAEPTCDRDAQNLP
jgi:hypothetical protein